MRQCPCCGLFFPAHDFVGGVCPDCGAGDPEAAYAFAYLAEITDVWRKHGPAEVWCVVSPDGDGSVLELVSKTDLIILAKRMRGEEIAA